MLFVMFHGEEESVFVAIDCQLLMSELESRIIVCPAEPVMPNRTSAAPTRAMDKAGGTGERIVIASGAYK